MRKVRIYLVIALAALIVSVSAGATEGPPSDPELAPVEQRVWDELGESPDREVTFVVAMREVPGAGPASAVRAQRGLEVPLAAMQRVGTVSDYTAYYGSNAIVVTGTERALQFVAAWPEVAEVRSYAPQEFDVPDAAARAARALNAEGSFTGTVTDLSASPLEGVLIRAYKQTGPTSWLVVDTATTEANGTYSVGSLATGIYRAEFEDLGGDYVSEFYNDKREFFQATSFDVTDGLVTPNINAALALGGKISGTVTELDTGDPVVDIAVSAWYTATGSWHNAGSGISSGAGAYVIDGLATGSYRLRFDDIYTVPRYLTEYYNNKATIDEGDDVTVTAGTTTSPIDAALGGYGSMTGTVYGEDGVTPLPDILVDLYEPDGYGGWQWASFDKTDGAGQYEAGGLVTRDYRIEYSDSLNPEQYATEFYNNKATVETGDDVHVELGLVTGNVDVSLALTPMAVTVPLAEGWNLMSLTLDPSQPAPEDALADIAGGYDVVWAYEACEGSPWEKYDPDLPVGNTLTAMDGGHGYWLETKTPAPSSVQVTGLRPATTSIVLCTGWNLVGYPSGVDQPVTEVLAGISGKYDLVYGYDATDPADPWKVYDPNFPVGNTLETMQPGWGYWLLMNQGATLTIRSR